jgi:hypothetical protein
MIAETNKQLTIHLENDEEIQMLSAIVGHAKISLERICHEVDKDDEDAIVSINGRTFCWGKVLDFSNEIIEKCENL